MSEVSKRDNQGKPQLSFILQFPTAIAAHARVKELGAIKYERDNWKKGGKPDHEYLDACLRHISAFMEGETFATDTGCTHLAHAMWNIMALQDLNYPGTVYDKELFDNMAEYWRDRREAEKLGFKFPSVEDWMNGNREIDMNDVRGDGGPIDVNMNDVRGDGGPIDVNTRNLWPRIDMDLPAERFEPLPGSGAFTLQEASEQLSAVMGTSVTQSMSAIQSVMDSFDPLDSLFAGHVTTTLEDGELIGKTNRSVEDLRAEAEANIAKHTELNAKEAAMEKKIIASRSFQRLIQEREQASYRKGYEAAQEDYRLPDVGQCDDPDCRCNA